MTDSLIPLSIHIAQQHRTMLLKAFHAFLIAGSLTAAFLLRFEFLIPPREAGHLYDGLLIALVCKSVVFHVARFDRGVWRFAGVPDLLRIIAANVIASLLFVAAASLMIGVNFPRSIYIIDLQLSIMLTAGARFLVRLIYDSRLKPQPKDSAKHVLIYGAGNAGITMLREIRSNRSLGYRAIGFLDDNPVTRNAYVDGIPVLGRGRDACLIADRYRRAGKPLDEIIIAMPSAAGRQMQEATANCRAAGVPCKTIPGIAEMLSGRVLMRQIREVSVLDLLGRDPISLDETQIRASVEGRVVMVTGAAGSIGSELCRQLARFDPSQMIAFEQAESELYRMQLEMADRFPQVEFAPCMGDIRDKLRVQEVIEKYRVNSIFHAAAYKHVPMMESHLLEAMRNNALGTYNLACAARDAGVGTFLMISSDKAVNPTNIMGATKRVAELIVSSMPVQSPGEGTRFVCVRFGNVLGSNGSVIPLFKKQIDAGGPVTVTHPEMRRYFMTIPEAVQLVLQASTMGHGSEIFLLDMGEPVSIVDLARNMIRLSGNTESDIEIRFTGLRPGEKLFEELRIEGENILPTYHDKIKVFCGQRPHLVEIEAWIRELRACIQQRNEAGALQLLKTLVPEYQPTGYWRELLSQTPVRLPAAKEEQPHGSERIVHIRI